VDLAPGEPVHEPAVNGAEGEVALLRLSSRSGYVVQNPLELGPGKIGIRNQSSLLPQLGVEPFFLKLLAEVGGPSALPDDGVVYRLARSAVPEDRGLPWFVIPMAEISPAWRFALSSASRIVWSWEAQICSGSCSTHPGRG